MLFKNVEFEKSYQRKDLFQINSGIKIEELRFIECLMPNVVQDDCEEFKSVSYITLKNLAQTEKFSSIISLFLKQFPKLEDLKLDTFPLNVKFLNVLKEMKFVQRIVLKNIKSKLTINSSEFGESLKSLDIIDCNSIIITGRLSKQQK